jgi:hypothetical protein
LVRFFPPVPGDLRTEELPFGEEGQPW